MNAALKDYAPDRVVLSHDDLLAQIDWGGPLPLWWLDFIACPHCGLCPCEEPFAQDAPSPKRQSPRPRPTPSSTIEAVLWSVRERGVAALKEPANVRRLATCDQAAKTEINRRIAKQR